MAKIGFLPLYAKGHLHPALSLAEALQKRGHDCVFFHLPDNATAVDEKGLRSAVFGRTAFPPGSVAQGLARSGELSGAPAFAFYLERMERFFAAALSDLPRLLRDESLDLLLVDQVMFAGGTLAEHVNVPFVTLALALLVNREPMLPPPNMPWPFAEDVAAQERNQAGWAAVDRAYVPLLNQINRQRRIWGLVAYENLLEDSFSCIAQISQQPSCFDFPRAHAPANLHNVGPLLTVEEPGKTTFDWDWLDGRPLVYASCGTIQNRIPEVFQTIIDACSALDVQAVVALGEIGLDPACFLRVGANVKIVRFAPQRQILVRAQLCITHAGLNTVLDCLAAGVPMVAIPLGSEQPGIAMRVQFHLLGVAVAPTELTATGLQYRIEAVLADRSIALRAKEMQLELATLSPLEAAVQVIERVLSVLPQESPTLTT